MRVELHSVHLIKKANVLIEQICWYFRWKTIVQRRVKMNQKKACRIIAFSEKHHFPKLTRKAWVAQTKTLMTSARYFGKIPVYDSWCALLQNFKKIEKRIEDLWKSHNKRPLTNFTTMLHFIKKPVTWFAKQIIWLVSIWNAILGCYG